MSQKLKVELQDENGNIYYLHTAADVVFLDDGTTVEAALEKKVTASGGDISNTKLATLVASSASFPVPEAGDAPKTLWGKAKKWQQDCLAKFANYVLTSAITNQYLNDTSKIPTAALMYLLKQEVNGLNSDLDNMAFNGSDLTLDELLDHYSVYNLPYIFGINYTSNASPDKNNTICIAIRNSIFAFSYSGKIFLANSERSGWREINYMQSNTINEFDFNDPTYDAGSYRLGSDEQILNSPSDSLGYGNVLVIKKNDYSGADTLAMLAFPYHEQGAFYYKSGNYQNWQSNKWFKFRGTEL